MKKIILLLVFFSAGTNVFAQGFRLYSFIDQRLATQKLDKESIDDMETHLPKLLGMSIEAGISADPVRSGYNELVSALDQINKGDVVIFYFAGAGDGKGTETGKQKVYIGGKPVTHQEIIDRVTRRGPKLAVILMEGSNSQALTKEGEYKHDHAGAVSKTSTKKLFDQLKSPADKGMLVYMNATEPPKPAQKNYKTGSYFLSSFKNNLYDELGESNPDWNNIINKVSAQVREFSRNVQKPYGNTYSIR